MRIMKIVFAIFAVFSFNEGISQEKIAVKFKPAEININDQLSNKNTPEKRSVTLQAVHINPAKDVMEKTHTSIVLDTIETKRDKRRQEIYLTSRPIGENFTDVQKSIQFESDQGRTRTVNIVELKATLITSKE